jgi:uncharacterized membrane protein
MLSDLAPWYLHIKFLHVFCVGIWSFSAVGAFWFVYVASRDRRAARGNEELLRRDEWVRWHFNNVVFLEHVAFPLVLLTGGLLFASVSWSLSAGWLALKLAIVLGLFVPMEILDTWLSHFHVPRAMRNKESQPERFKRALRRQDTFLKYSSWLVLLLVPSVLFLALVKPL